MADFTAGKNAANTATGYFSSGNDTAQGYLDQGQSAAQAYLQGAGDKANGYYGQAADAVRSGYGTGTQDLQFGFNNAVGAYGATRDMYSNLATNYGKGADMYSNALGLNGQAGSDAARAAFTASPGYNWQVGQGLDALSRQAAAGGMAASGNNMVDGLKYAQGQAAGEWNNWLGNLSGYNGLQLTAAQGVAGANTQIGDAYTGYGQNQAQLAANQGQSLAGIYGAQAGMNAAIGGQQASTATGTAQQKAGTAYQSSSDAGNAQYSGAIADQKAKLQDDANNKSFWANIIGSVAKLGSAAVGKWG